MRRIRFIVLGLLAVPLAVGGFLSGRRLLTRVLAAEAVKCNPFTIQYEDYFVQDGKKIAMSVATIYQASNGDRDTASQMYNRDGSPSVLGRKINIEDGPEATVVDSIKSKSTYPIVANELARKHALQRSVPPPNCVYGSDTLDGVDTILGRTADRFVKVSTDNLQRRTGWRFPDFRCMELQITRGKRLNSTDPWTLWSGTDLLNVTEGEPDPSLFVIPSDYAEMKPSDLKRAYWTSRGITIKQCLGCFADELQSDAVYAKK